MVIITTAKEGQELLVLHIYKTKDGTHWHWCQVPIKKEKQTKKTVIQRQKNQMWWIYIENNKVPFDLPLAYNILIWQLH